MIFMKTCTYMKILVSEIWLPKVCIIHGLEKIKKELDFFFIFFLIHVLHFQDFILAHSKSRLCIKALFFCRFLSIHSRKIIFLVKFSKLIFWWIFTFWSILNPEFTFFSGWYVGGCVCMCVCMFVCYQNNAKTNYFRNSKLCILHSYHT